MKDSFGARLRFFRSKVGLSQQQLADSTGLSRKIISDYEVKLDVMPREGNLYKIAEALGIDSSNLVPKTNMDDAEKQSDGVVGVTMNLHEFPRGVVEFIKESALKNNRSIDDEFNFIINQAVNEAIKKYQNGEKEDYSQFDSSPPQVNEAAFEEYLKNH